MRISIYFTFFIFTCFSCNTSVSQEQTSHVLSPQTFKKMMEDDNVVVLDVRTPGEVAEGVIGKPTIINFQDADFEARLTTLDKTKTYLVYCKAGGRSSRAKAILDSNGFKDVYDLDGGITAWNAAGLLINK